MTIIYWALAMHCALYYVLHMYEVICSLQFYEMYYYYPYFENEETKD